MFFLDQAKYYNKMPTHHTGFISKTIISSLTLTKVNISIKIDPFKQKSC